MYNTCYYGQAVNIFVENGIEDASLKQILCIADIIERSSYQEAEVIVLTGEIFKLFLEFMEEEA